jgi:hypothetical protein
MPHHTVTWSSTNQITSVAPCCTRASVVAILRDSDRRIRTSLWVGRRNVIILHRAHGSVMKDNHFSVQWVPGSFAGGKAARTRSWLFSSSWYRAKKSWNSIFIVTYACCASCFISREKILPLSYLLFVFIIFMCCSTTKTCLDITNAVILKVTGTHCLNDKWRGSFTSLYYCNVRCIYTMYVYTLCMYIHVYTKHVTNITNKLCNVRYLNYSDMEFKVVNQPFRKNNVSLCRRSSIG